MDVVEIGIDDIEAAFEAQSCAAVLFSLNTCAPCELLRAALCRVGPSFPKLTRCYVAKLTFGIDHEDPRLDAFGVRHFPTLVVYENGHLLGVLRGAVTKAGPLNDERLMRWLLTSLGEPAPVTENAPG